MPVAAYNVSGEFSMVHGRRENGWIDRERAMVLEVLTLDPSARGRTSS